MSSILNNGFVTGATMVISSHCAHIISWEMVANGFKAGYYIGKVAKVALPIILLLNFLLSKEANAYPFYAILEVIGGSIVGLIARIAMNRLYMRTPGYQAEMFCYVVSQDGR